MKNIIAMLMVFVVSNVVMADQTYIAKVQSVSCEQTVKNEQILHGLVTVEYNTEFEVGYNCSMWVNVNNKQLLVNKETNVVINQGDFIHVAKTATGWKAL